MNYVYCFKNYKNEIIYVGRTNNIKRRMKEHFEKGHLLKECYEEVSTIIYSETNESKYDTEICETLLISQYKPKYNTEKKWNEYRQSNSYNQINLNFKEINIYFLNDEFNIELNEFTYPCYNELNSELERCKLLIDYNLGNLKHRRNIYKNLNKDIFLKNRRLYSVLINLYEFVKCNICVQESNVDEPITDTGDITTSYVSFEIKKINELKIKNEDLALIIHCGYIFRISDEIYAIPLHTNNVLKTINKNYLK